MSLHATQEQFSANLQATTSPNIAAANPETRAEPMRVAELDFKNGWVSDIATRQVYQPTPYTSVGGKPVCNGAAGYNGSGAHGIRPILCP